MAGRDIVADELGALDALCIVLRRHGVTTYERTSDGAIRLELLPQTPERSASAHGEAEPQASLSSVPRSDPLFDGVEGV